MLWNTPQSGYNTQYPGLNCVDLRSGDDYALLNGTETLVSGSKSVHFSAGPNPSGAFGWSAEISGCSNGSVIAFQASNGVAQSANGEIGVSPVQTPTNLDASFNTLATMPAGNGAYTDAGGSQYYRCVVSTFVAGDAPVVIVRMR